MMTQAKRKAVYTGIGTKEGTLFFSHQYHLTPTHFLLSEVIT